MNGLLYHLQKLFSDSILTFASILPASYGKLDNFQLDLEYMQCSHTWALFILWRSSDLRLYSFMHWNVEQIGNMQPGASINFWVANAWPNLTEFGFRESMYVIR